MLNEPNKTQGTILITGGAGFIGSNLSKSLIEDGYQLRIIDNLSPQIHTALPENLSWLKASGIEFIRASINDIDKIEGVFADVQQIIHLASETGTGQSMYELVNYSETNVSGTASILQALTNIDHNVERFILASSRAVYGEGAYVCNSCGENERLFPTSRSLSQLKHQLWDFECEVCGSRLTPVPTKESDVTNPGSIYACSKLAQEDFVRVTCNALNIDYALLRLQNVYGEGQALSNPYTGIISVFTNRILQGIDLLIFEDGKESRDFIHVSDVVNIFRLAVNNKEPISKVINVGTGIKTSVEDLAQLLSKLLSISPKLIYKNLYRLGDIRHNYADTSTLKETFNYSTFTKIDDGLDRYLNWASKKELPEDRLDEINNQLILRGLMNGEL